jgi:hypothetical protein
MKKLFLLVTLVLPGLASFSQPQIVYRSKVIYAVTRICQRERTKDGQWNAPYNCKNTYQDLIIKDSRLEMIGDTGKALILDFDGLGSFDDMSVFNASNYKDPGTRKAKDQDGKECCLYFVNNNDDFYLVLDYDGSATLLYLSNARPMK